MKRLSLIFAALMLTILQISADNKNATITLSHNGTTRTFSYDEPYAAVDNAVDGDTIYFGNGKVEGDFTLTKKLTFIGVGADRDYHSEISGYYPYTEYSGNIVINLPEDTKLTTRLFEGIYFSWNSNGIIFQSAIKNVIFKKCYLSNPINNEKEIDGLYLDRCEASSGEICKAWYATNVICRNCKLGYADNSSRRNPQTWYFYNCTFAWANTYSPTASDGTTYDCCLYINGIFTNCIFNTSDDAYHSLPLYAYKSDNQETSIASFTNCLFYPLKEDLGVDMFAPGTTTSGIMYYTRSSDNTHRIDNLTKEELQQNNFLGTDGTVVGCQGGKNPFSLTQAQAKISSAKVHLDREQGKVQIKVNVSVTQ